MTPGSVRRVRVRLLPWRPRWRQGRMPDADATDGLDLLGDDLGIGVLVGLGLLVVLLFLPLVLAVLVLSVEVLVVVALAPLLVVVQLVGLRPWYLAVTTVDGQRTYVCAGRTRAMLKARRYYRSLRV